jgi:hypothetical protein
MTFDTKYDLITFQAYPMNLTKLEHKKEKYLDNYFNLVTHLKISCWSFQERNLTLVNDKRMGHELWNGRGCAVRISYPYVTSKEMKWVKGIIKTDALTI